MPYQFKAHVIITGQITCMTGLHIGGTEEKYAIGGIDNPIIKDKITGYPYIPGSSIKGKMRSLAEWFHGKVTQQGKVHTCADPQCKVCRIYGTSVDQRGRKAGVVGPTRLIVRDAHLSQETRADARYLQGGIFNTEIKTENRLNRITAAAHPRFIERVPKGAKFDLELIYGIYDMGDGGETDIANLEELGSTLSLLQASALGSGGSRGSGHITIEQPQAVIKRLHDYQDQAEAGKEQGLTLTDTSFTALIEKIRQRTGLL